MDLIKRGASDIFECTATVPCACARQSLLFEDAEVGAERLQCEFHTLDSRTSTGVNKEWRQNASVNRQALLHTFYDILAWSQGEASIYSARSSVFNTVV